jgi:hypothetical protein
MLETLQRATDPKSVEHASILSFLQARLAERQNTLQTKELHPPNSRNPKKFSTAPHPLSLPLLVSTTSPPVLPGEYSRPSYAPAYRPRPLTELPPGKKRKIPKLDLAGDFPLLRMKKPQPPILARILTQKIKKRAERQTLELNMQEEQLEDWRDEDWWEHRIMKLLDTEVVTKCLTEKKADARLPGALKELQDYFWTEDENQSYEANMRNHGISYIREALVREREDAVAKADAMRMIIAGETALAETEEVERKLERRKQWEVRMLAEHGGGWRQVVEAEHRMRKQSRDLIAKSANNRGAEKTTKRKQKDGEGNESTDWWATGQGHTHG